MRYPMTFGPAPLSSLRTELDRLFDRFTDGGFMGPSQFRPYPALNVWEDEEALHAEAEVPGVDMKDLNIEVQGDELIIRGGRRVESEENLAYHRRERGTGEFSRAVTLPMKVDANAVEAQLRNGVLAIRMPKAAEARPRRIEVKRAD